MSDLLTAAVLILAGLAAGLVIGRHFGRLAGWSDAIDLWAQAPTEPPADWNSTGEAVEVDCE